MTEQKISSDKLNLGCGGVKKAGYLNVDWNPLCEPDVRVNLQELPYPFEDNQFALVEASHIFEHLDDVFGIMREVHRILRPGGEFVLRVPHFSRGFTHAEHRRGFDVGFPLYFQASFEFGYYGVDFDLAEMRLKWFAQPYLKKKVLPPWMYFAGAGAGHLLDWLANLSPFFCSRVWCFWVGGFEEIEYRFICRK